MNTIIHDVTYAYLNTMASPVRGNICLVSPDMGRFWSGVSPPDCILPAGFLFLPLLDIICLLDISSLDLVGPVPLYYVRFYPPQWLSSSSPLSSLRCSSTSSTLSYWGQGGLLHQNYRFPYHPRV